jgi:hypothetical protein
MSSSKSCLGKFRLGKRVALVPVLVLVAAGASGCRAFAENCHAPQEYQTAVSAPALKVPEGLSAPQTRSALKIPDIGETAKPRGRGEPCLDEPPSFYPGRPKPGMRSDATTDAPKPPEVATPAEAPAPQN